MNDKNRFVAEKLGVMKTASLLGGPPYDSPDFSTDSGAVELLRLMRAHSKYDDFLSFLEVKKDVYGIDDFLILITTPGALLQAVAEYFGGEK